jgi:hypothetical protein
LALVAVSALGLTLTGCTAGPGNDPKTTRLWTEDYYIRVTSDPSPPRALEPIQYTVIVQDKKTREPIDVGEGRIFATNEDRKNTDNGFEKGEAPGTYKTKLFFATAGKWAMGIQFRHDSTKTLQRTNDWYQDVLQATEPGQDAAKSRSGQ